MKSLVYASLAAVCLVSEAANAACTLSPPPTPPPGDIYYLDADFGAACASVLDPGAPLPYIDSALETALCVLEQTGGTLVFPKGQYCHISRVHFLEARGFVLEGNGATLVTGLPHTPTAGGLGIEDSADFEVRNLVVHGAYDYEVDEHSTISRPVPGANRNDCQAPAGLAIRSSSNGVITNVRSYSSLGDGMAIRPTENGPIPSNISLIACHAERNCRHGFTVAGATNTQFLGGRAVNNAGLVNAGGELGSAGIRLEPNPPNLDPISQLLVSGMIIADNAGPQIQAYGGGGDGSNISELRFIGNVVAGSPDVEGPRYGRAAVLLNSGRDVIFQANQFRDFDATDTTEGAGVNLTALAQGITIEGNRFENFATPNSVIYVALTATANDITIINNQFKNLSNVSEPLDTAVSAINSDRAGTVISRNQIFNSTMKGIRAIGAGTVADGNEMRDMKANAVMINAPDAVFTNNKIAVNIPGSNTAGDSVVRLRGTNNIAHGNSLFCADAVQRGYYFDFSPVLFNDNSVKQCVAPGWTFAGGLPLVNADNRQY